MSQNYHTFESIQEQKELGGGKIVYNFCPGPCILPKAVLKKCQEEMLDYRGSGMSVMELNHRKPEYVNIHNMCIAEIRKFLSVPDDYRIELTQGGATQQWTALVKNLVGLKPQRKGMFVTTGMWSEECLREAKKFMKPEQIIEVCNTQASGYTSLPDPSTWKIDNDASFLHICMNETVHGFEIPEEHFPWEKFSKDLCIIGDLSSNMGTRKIDWNKFSMVYAGAQKNMGPSGSTIVIVKRSLLGKADPDVPVMCDWEKNEKYLNGYYNTPPCWAIYVMALNVSYMNQQGGLENYDRLAEAKSKMLFAVIDGSNGYYVNKTDKRFRSRMNVIMRIAGSNSELEKKLQVEAEKVKILNIAGHWLNPGIRMSIYNAMPIEGVIHLCNFLQKFQKENPLIGANAPAKL